MNRLLLGSSSLARRCVAPVLHRSIRPLPQSSIISSSLHRPVFPQVSGIFSVQQRLFSTEKVDPPETPRPPTGWERYSTDEKAKNTNQSESEEPFQDPNKNKEKTGRTKAIKVPILPVMIGSGVLAYLIVDRLGLGGGVAAREITWQEFRSELLEAGRVRKVVVINKDTVLVHTSSDSNPSHFFHIGSVDSFERSLDHAQNDIGVDPSQHVPVFYAQESRTAESIISSLPGILSVLFTLYLLRMFSSGMPGAPGAGGKMKDIFGIGKANPTIIGKDLKVKTMFKDVAGLDEAKQEVMEFVHFLKNPEKYKALGAKMPRGALLVGPPGTGKTLLARATAGEASVPFFSISGSDFVEMFVGVGPSRVRDLFAQAREKAPAIVFIDEIDAVGKQRGKGGFSGGNQEQENTLNQLLVEMDGFNPSSGIVVLAGTNRVDILDKALLRPGRFDRQILIDKPDLAGRKAIFKVHLAPLKLDPNFVVDDYANRLATLTPGFSGAEIANVCNEAAIIAARNSRSMVTFDDFEKATERVIGGLEKKTRVLAPEEKRAVAYHEAGHAIVGWFRQFADPLLKVTIVPRNSGALGYAQYLPDEIFLMTKDQLVDRISMALGGRAAEQVFFGKVSTGAADDLNKVTQMAQAMVCMYGMSDKLGNISYRMEGDTLTKPFSEATAALIDEEVRKLISQIYDDTIKLIETRRDEVSKLAELLLEKETINHHDVVNIIGSRPWPVKASYQEYLAQPVEMKPKTETPVEEEKPASESAAAPSEEPFPESSPSSQQPSSSP